MRILLLLFITLLLSFSAFPQQEREGRCIIEKQMSSTMVKVSDQIGDFTIEDSDGVTWNLYEQLNQGRTVFIDLFFST